VKGGVKGTIFYPILLKRDPDMFLLEAKEMAEKRKSFINEKKKRKIILMTG
jgi:hypothetical protein